MQTLGILSDHGEDVIWQCEAENVDLLLLETDFSPAAEDTKDVSARCDIAIEVRRRPPECRCIWPARTAPGKLPALDKAVELALIGGYCVGSITPAADAHMAERSGRGHAPTEPP